MSNTQTTPRETVQQQPRMSLSTIALVLGALTAGGGITGYVRTGSIPSVVAGVSVGTLYLLGGYRLQQKASYGVELALIASVVLAGSSIPRAIRGGFKPLPTGLSVLATIGLVAYGNAFVNKTR
ncbi:hypothetical protein CLAFUW4_07797 [Fulvia fulva]|uniref:Uncharacterized protein n=1 Tax=Passalora fulva TaxID=5499 RepID=A0A9Q8LCR3_PASFU|nr:uncharacterized protein CLAFUR5_07921 [Fulvia fulva]KAK4629717.1 hypothetical protein CLAFUR4_07802 [Fulvia fulva]KAK4630297.1 hypothetical protein CLAFUR0_07799 [Fulvia fulva]UJO14814.1 hypothetical protein CLAFUR5_07921 [Fulvia fulva]WPV12351.1 hypothetical protein CLAFUW4_07797 [Fulvia fulva]WPV28000.1 hypothetical protein CLAFUW7_07798 [Fulvia fulva]